jgi:hypothetical protein
MQQQTQTQKKYKDLFTIDQHEIPKVNPQKTNEYLTNLLIEGFDSFIDGVHVTTRLNFVKNNKKVIANQVSIFKEKTNEMVINIYHNDSYKVVVEKLDALTDYMKGKTLYNKLRQIKGENKWI